MLCETDLSRDIANKTYLDSPVADSRTTGQEKLAVIVVVSIAVSSKYEAAKKIRNWCNFATVCVFQKMWQFSHVIFRSPLLISVGL